MNLDSTLLTVDWLNRELDKIIILTEYIDELIQDTDENNILDFLQNKLIIGKVIFLLRNPNFKIFL